MSLRNGLNLRPGDWVEVRRAEEILATLDDRGCLEGLPFMPEMLQFCGRRLRVFKRADKTCDTIAYTGSRRMHNTVHLEGARCDGQAHGGCGARCLTFWKEAWLRPAQAVERADGKSQAGATNRLTGPISDPQRLSATTWYHAGSDNGDIRYRCQATELPRASTPLPWWDVRQYVRDVRSGNVGVMEVVRAAAFRGFLQLLKLRGYRVWMWCYNRVQSLRGGRPFPYLVGTLDNKTPHETLDLKPGELVEVKSHQEILRTINKENRNRGLRFDAEMVRECGRVHRVLSRVERMVDERTGKLITLSSDCLILEGAYCRSEYSDKRLFCPRSLHSYWREIWLKRVELEDERTRIHAPPPACAALSGTPGKGDA